MKYGQTSDPKFHNTQVCEEDQHPKPCQKPWDISSATARPAPNLLKALTILSDTTVRRSAIDWEELKSYWKSEKSHVSLADQQAYYLQVSKRLY